MERKKPTILDNPPSEETALKMAEFFMERILATEKAEKEAKATVKNDK